MAVVPNIATPQDEGCQDWCTPPSFSEGSTATRSFDENIGDTKASRVMIGAPFAATDADEGDNVIYEPIEDPNDPIPDDPSDTSTPDPDSDAHLFELDHEGQLWTKPGINYDFEEKSSFRIRLVICDNAYNRDRIVVTINLRDLKEPPRKPDPPEGEGASTTTLAARWTEPDNEDRTPITSYDLQRLTCPGQGQCPTNPGGTDWPSTWQNVNGTNTVISGLTESTWYLLRVRARNRDDPGEWSDPSLPVRTDAPGNNPPVFLESSPERRLAENTPPDRNIGTPVRATGDDSLTYSLDESAPFDIADSTGQIRTRFGETYNFEATESYSVSVTAKDPDGDSATISVTIFLEDVDEPPDRPTAPLVLTLSDTSLSVSWTPPNDEGRPPIDHYDLEYRQGTSGSWNDGPQDVTGTSTSITGLEEGTSYQVQVRATNAEGDSPWSPPGSSATSGGGNNTPTFGNLPVLSFPESIGDAVTRTEADIGMVTAMDADLDDPMTMEKLTYSLQGPATQLFTIVTTDNKAQIRTKQGINYDYETDLSYMVTVKVEDSTGASDTAVVTIDLVDQPEPPNKPDAPTLTTGPQPTTSLTVTWNPPDNKGRPPIDDYDVRYGQQGSNAWTEIRNVSGLSTTIPDPNLNLMLTAGTVYEVQVLARNTEGTSAWSDSGTGKTAESTDPNNPNAPDFGADSTTRSFPENPPTGYDIGDPVTADDDDGDTLKYRLKGTDASSFTVVPSSGQLRTKSGVSYDYETKNIYHVIVEADDVKGKTDAIAVTINVTDLPENGGGDGGNRGGGGIRSPSGGGGGGDEETPGRIGEPPAFGSASVTRVFPENTAADRAATSASRLRPRTPTVMP